MATHRDAEMETGQLLVDSLGRLVMTVRRTSESPADSSALRNWATIAGIGLMCGIVALVLLTAALIALPLSVIASLWRLCIRRPFAALRRARLSRMAL